MGLLRQNAIPFAENSSIFRFLFRTEPLLLAKLIERDEGSIVSDPGRIVEKLAAELADEKLRRIQLEYKLQRLQTL